MDRERVIAKVMEKLAVEEFHFMGLSFDIDAGLKLAKKYKIDKSRAQDFKGFVPEQSGGFGLIRVDVDHAKKTDLTKPVLIATLLFDGKEGGMLIDGHHRIYKALWIEKTPKVPSVTLSFEDSMAIMDGYRKRKMISEGKKLGLIKSKTKKKTIS